MSATSEAAGSGSVEAKPAAAAELEALFLSHYACVARVIARLVRDTSLAEELAVDVFLKLWYKPWPEDSGMMAAWLHRSAVRKGLDELLRQSRRSRYERLFARFGAAGKPPTPEDIHASQQEQARVRALLARLKPAQAELVVLRGEGLSYQELAAALRINPASVGTKLARAQDAFRKEYERHHGKRQ